MPIELLQIPDMHFSIWMAIGFSLAFLVGYQLLLLFYCLGRAVDPWPAISDDEFLRRCSPGTRRETALKVRKIISEQLGVEYYRIYPEHHFRHDLGCD